MSNKYKSSGYAMGTTIIGGIKGWSDTMNTQVESEPTSGQVTPSHVGILEQKPTRDIPTVQIARALGALGLNGLGIAGLTGGCKLYLHKIKDGGSRDTSGHRAYSVLHGLVVPATLSATQSEDAQLTIREYVGWDGANDPITDDDDATLPTILDDEKFTLGPVVIESVDMSGLTKYEINFGHTVEQVMRDGYVWPTLVYTDKLMPVLTVTCENASVFGSAKIPMGGKTISHANTTFYLRKRKVGSTNYADNETEHIKFTCAGMVHVENTNDGSGNVEVQVTAHNDGVNDPLTITTGTAIS